MLIICSRWFLFLMPQGFIPGLHILFLMPWGFILHGLIRTCSSSLFLMPHGFIPSGLTLALFCVLFLMPQGFMPYGLTLVPSNVSLCQRGCSLVVFHVTLPKGTQPNVLSFLPCQRGRNPMVFHFTLPKGTQPSGLSLYLAKGDQPVVFCFIVTFYVHVFASVSNKHCVHAFTYSCII